MRRLKCEKETIILTNEDDGFYDVYTLSLIHILYHFDTKDHVFEKADRFTERQKEKEAQAAKTEKAGKEQPDQKPKTKKHDMEL